MAAPPIQVQLLGGFSIRRGDAAISVSTRSRKLCLLLACLIQSRSRPVPYAELFRLLWDEREANTGSLNTLKAILHRARACLDQLGPDAGRELLLSREGCYQWNPEVSLTLDTEEFLRLCQAGDEAQGTQEQLPLRLAALRLFPGDFLPGLTDHPWAAVQAEQLHKRYLSVLLDALPLLADCGQHQTAAQLAQSALALEPLREDLCRWQLESLLQLDRRQQAAQVYEAFHQRLLAQAGVLPSERLRDLYRQAQRGQDPRAISPVTLQEQLMESPGYGPLFCEYDFLRAICRSVARMAERTGAPVHAALVSITGAQDAPLAQYSLERAMDNLEEIIRARLRRGDAFSRCSASQFVLLLPQATHENSQMVCGRITRAFTRQYPHSPAQLQVSVQPLLPPSSTKAKQ